MPTRKNVEGDAALDPTKMINQPALRSSKGTIWIVMGGLFLLASLFSFGVIIFTGGGASTGLAITCGCMAIAAYAALLVVRFAVAPGPRRLRIMAACMLTMAFISLVGVWVCLFIESLALEAASR